MTNKPFLKIFLLSVLLHIIVIPFRGGWAGIDYSSIVGFITYFFLAMFCLEKYKKTLPTWKILLALFSGRCFIDSPVIIYYFLGETWSLPEFLLHALGIICGFLYRRLKKPLNILTALLCFSIAVFMFFQGYNYWLHKRNFGTFTGEVSYSLPTKFEAFDESKNLITESNLNNKIILLDFWHTRCGVCFEKFPQVQAVYEKYKNDPSVMILAVDKPIEEDKPNQAFEMIREEGYSFPVVIARDEDMPEKFGVKGYPTTFVINPKGNIVFKGDIAGAVRQVEKMKR